MSLLIMYIFHFHIDYLRVINWSVLVRVGSSIFYLNYIYLLERGNYLISCREVKKPVVQEITIDNLVAKATNNLTDTNAVYQIYFVKSKEKKYILYHISVYYLVKYIIK